MIGLGRGRGRRLGREAQAQHVGRRRRVAAHHRHHARHVGLARRRPSRPSRSGWSRPSNRSRPARCCPAPPPIASRRHRTATCHRYAQFHRFAPRNPASIRAPQMSDIKQNPQLLDHRAHRPRQVDAGRPADPRHRRDDRARDGRHRASARQYGDRAGARDHDQGADRAARSGRPRTARPTSSI